MPLLTLCDVFYRMLEHDLPETMICRDHGVWRNISARETYQRVHSVSRALQAWSISRGERTAILSENRPEWAIADFASLLIGAVDVPIYPTLTTEQTAFILRDAGVRIAFVSTADQFRKVQSIQSSTAVEKIVVMDDVGLPGATSMASIMGSGNMERDAAYDANANHIAADDLATIIYTSGTTGTPKGVMLTHGNITSNLHAAAGTFEWSLKPGYISFLPLSHITARHVDYNMFALGIGISYCPSFDDLGRTIQEVNPANFVSVPRVYEKIRQEVERRTGSGIKRAVFDWCMSVGRKHRAEILAGRRPTALDWQLADRLLFKRVRSAFGKRMEGCVSGGAPLGLDLAEWFADAGVPIYEGYGLTETSPVISINSKSHLKLGTVGRPLPNVECKIAEDGELLVRGPSVTKGYWHLPEETTAAFVDGWFRTGDIGEIDADGYLRITDRKKDLIKTSGGKFVAPQPIENALKTNVLVAQAALIGEKRKFISVVIAPHFPLLEDWAHANKVVFSSRVELVHDQKIRALYEGIVADLNSRLAQFERVKRIILVPDEFTVTSGELTPSLKLKRRFVEKKYTDLIDSLYAEAHLPDAVHSK
jgi:long-chain acyl-CoA synthetase